MPPTRTPVRRRALLCALALTLAGCGGAGGGEPAPAEGAKGATTDSAAAAERARADSAARFQARFGNRVPRPDSVRALYVNAWAAGSRSRMRELIRVADETEINAFVIDIKESDTYLTHDSTAIPLAKEIGADQRPGSKWLPALVDTLRAHGIYPIARIVVFKDRMLAEKKPDMAIRSTSGGTWLDQKGKPWVNPYDRRVWDYNIAIAREALDMGFAEVQWDYVRFPDVTESMRRTMAFPGAGEKSRADNIHDFIVYSKQRLAEYQVPVTADVFGLVTHLEGDVGIGQNWEKVITAADAVLPMVYPSHYYAGMYGFQRPNAHPYELVRVSMQDAVERTRLVQAEGKKTGEIVPWLQAFTADYLRDGITYGAGHVRNQIQATYDAGLKSWVLWNPGSNYQVYYAALRPRDGSPSPLERGGWRPVRWEVPRGRLNKVVRQREAAERAAKAAQDSAARTGGAQPRPAAGPATKTGG
ncbi:MAG TPA: putative glycoside hydrolase [Longimicrobium sp.]|nr:putative glycoside hydrolase [Longimicrobium sp.]